MITRKDYLKIEQTSYNIDYFTKHPENVDKLKNKDHIPILKKMLGITTINEQTTPSIAVVRNFRTTATSTLEEETGVIEITETPEKTKEEPKPKKKQNQKKQ